MPRRKLETEAELPASAAKKANATELLLYNPSAPENNADENILDPAEYFFKNTRYHNCHLIVGNPPEVETIGFISLHLIGHSTVFRRMLQDSDLADPTGVNTKITDVRPEIFKLILRHVYGGQLPDMDRDTAAELLLSADKYNIQPLVRKASALLKPTSVEDVFPALRCVIYVSLSLPELTTQVAKIVQENTYELIKSKQFLQLDINCLEFITKQESLTISELELWECLVDWAKNQAPTKELRKLLDKPLRHFPKTSMEWEIIAKEYEEMWNFPNCGGAIDGKHVKIFKPADEGSYYFNYKGYHSVVLLAIVDANLNFIMADVGCNGRVSDGGVIEETTFYRKLKSGELNLPNKENTVSNMNYVFIADEAFALQKNLLKPFPRKDLTYERRIFNYRLSRARRCVENAFGVLASRFRIFHTTINLHPSKVDDIVMACVVLHNFLRKNNRAQYSPSSMLDREDLESARLIEGDWRNGQPQGSFHGLRQSRKLGPAKEAFDSRDVYVNYFNGPGKVSFQDRMVKK